jgi:hypothetical protein
MSHHRLQIGYVADRSVLSFDVMASQICCAEMETIVLQTARVFGPAPSPANWISTQSPGYKPPQKQTWCEVISLSCWLVGFDTFLTGFLLVLLGHKCLKDWDLLLGGVSLDRCHDSAVLRARSSG